MAAQIFADKGFASSTIRDIATDAGILSGSLYYHFDSKEAMAVEILDSAFAGLLVKYSELPDSGDLRARIEKLIMIGFEFTMTSPDAAAIIQNDYAQWKHDAKFSAVNDKYDAIRDVWLDLLRAAQDVGLVRRSINVKLAYRAMMGGLFSTGQWFDPEGPMSIEDVARAHIDIFLNGMLEHAEDGPRVSDRLADVSHVAESAELREEISHLKTLLADAVIGKLAVSRDNPLNR